ncbi:MAG: hypothetical protein QGD94_08445 [Planctomycetia bacterium]|nr:hypothetical protein [Planctomycetia bacterium]
MYHLLRSYKLKRIDDPLADTRTYVEDGIALGLLGLGTACLFGWISWCLFRDALATFIPQDAGDLFPYAFVLVALVSFVCSIWCFVWRRRLVFDLRNRELRMVTRRIIGIKDYAQKFESLGLSIHKEVIRNLGGPDWEGWGVSVLGPGLSARMARVKKLKQAEDFAREVSSATGIPVCLEDD